MNKMNKKGFVLVETLVVTIFTLFTFSILYTNIVPLLGKYQQLTYYNDLDATYDLYHLRKFLRTDTEGYAAIKQKNYQVITCNNETISILKQESCYALFDFLGIDPTVDELIFLKSAYKDYLQVDPTISQDVKEYMDYITISGNVLILQNDGFVTYLNA